MRVGDIVYYARIIPYCDIYEICELRIRTVKNNWFVGIDKRDKHAYCFYLSDIDRCIFHNRADALKKVKEAEKNRVSTYYKEKESEDEYED